MVSSRVGFADWGVCKCRQFHKERRAALAASRENCSVQHCTIDDAPLGNKIVSKSVDRPCITEIDVNGRHVGITRGRAQVGSCLICIRSAGDNDRALQLRQTKSDAETEAGVCSSYEHDLVAVRRSRKGARGC